MNPHGLTSILWLKEELELYKFGLLVIGKYEFLSLAKEGDLVMKIL